MHNSCHNQHYGYYLCIPIKLYCTWVTIWEKCDFIWNEIRQIIKWTLHVWLVCNLKMLWWNALIAIQNSRTYATWCVFRLHWYWEGFTEKSKSMSVCWPWTLTPMLYVCLSFKTATAPLTHVGTFFLWES